MSLLNLFDDSTAGEHLPPISEKDLTDEQVIVELIKIKDRLKDQVVVLGHHYQQDDIIRFADITGDSLQLAREAAKLDHSYIIFCGVHFMAETADMLSSPEQKVILPDLNAGCSMADMANSEEIEECWKVLTQATQEIIIPITYINSSAILKSFVGKHEGSICTSSNAKKMINWAFNQGQKLLFFPDQHLGRNTCFEMGIPLEQMVTYDPRKINGGLTTEQIQQAKVILWYGHCSVHQGFDVQQIQRLKKHSPETTVIVHPECSFEVVQASDLNGSTSYIIETIKNASPGSKFAVGTEINLVNRLAAMFPDKTVSSLSPYQCLCTTMYRIRPRWLLHSFQMIEAGRPENIITVDETTRIFALKALETMLSVP